jgi:Aminoglycoside-2''-adenylyltransferase
VTRAEEDVVQIEPAEVCERLRALAITAPPLWLSGGVAVDFLVGRWTRPHKDVDLVALEPDRGQLQRELAEGGFLLVQDGAWTTRWSLGAGADADVEIIFVEPAAPDTGVLVVPEDDPAGGRAGRYPFVAGYLDPRRFRVLDGVRARVCSPEGEWLNRVTGGDLVPGRGSDPKIRHDVRLLESLLPAARRRELLDAYQR